ncbi:328_t:CDS:1, partial [Acaulospora colombiana]
MSVNGANTPEVELLKQCISELEAKNAEIPDLKRKVSEFDDKRTELKRRIAKTLRSTEETSKWRDTENTKLKVRIEELESENVDFRDRLTKVEQKQLQNNNTPNKNPSNFNSDTSLPREPIPEVSP